MAISSLYEKAIAKTKEARAQQRVRLFGDDMKFFHHALRQAGYVKSENGSVFALSDEAFAEFASSKEPGGSPPARYFMLKAGPLSPAP